MDAQGDTGANFSATNDKSILWDYKILPEPIPVITYDHGDTQEGHTCEAIGQGVIKIIDDNNSITQWYSLHTPGATGTILSLDHYATHNHGIHTFKHIGHITGKGSIEFTDQNNNVITSLTM